MEVKWKRWKITEVKTTCVLHQVGGVPGWQALLSAVGFRLDFSGGNAGLPAAVFFPTSDPGDRLQQCSNTLQSLLGTAALPKITFLSHVCHCDWKYFGFSKCFGEFMPFVKHVFILWRSHIIPIFGSLFFLSNIPGELPCTINYAKKSIDLQRTEFLALC